MISRLRRTVLFNGEESDAPPNSLIKNTNRSGVERLLFSIRFECTTIEEISDLAEQLEATLQKSSKDTNLKISHFKKGSVIIVIEGTRDAYKVLKSLFKAGQLTTLLGKQIIDIMAEY